MSIQVDLLSILLQWKIFFLINLSELVAELVERVDANEHLKDHIFELRCKI